MNERIQKLYDQADKFAKENRTQTISGPGNNYFELFHEKFAQLIVQECMAIARNREDELESANLLRESRAVGIVVHRMARQFGVKE